LLAGETEPSDIAHQLNRRNEGIGTIPAPIINRSLTTPALERLALGDDFYPGVAYELNRKFDGLSIKPAPAGHSAIAKTHARPRRTPGFGEMEAEEALYFAGPFERPRLTAQSLVRAVSSNPESAAKAESSVEIPWVAGWGTMVFQDHLRVPLAGETQESRSPQAGLGALRSHARFQQLVPLEGCDDLWLETAGAVSDEIDGFGDSPVTLAAEPKLQTFSYEGTELGEELFEELVGGMIEERSDTATSARSNPPIAETRGLVTSSKPTAGFAPLEVADDLYVGVAYELNLRGERSEPTGLTIASVKLPPSNVTPSVRELGRAVKLTRDALSAWFKVFTGPAIVTASK
jgi:hypothetical protein